MSPHPGASETLELCHCRGARSFRVLWALEELRLPYKLHLLPFPPRQRAQAFLAVNPLGTASFLGTDSGARMSESTAIVQYLTDRYGSRALAVGENDPEYRRQLNFLHMSDATLTFPQTLYLRFAHLEAPDRRVPQVADDDRRWFASRLSAAMSLMAGDDCCGDRFSAADIPEAAMLYFERLKRCDGYSRACEAERP